MKNLLSEGLLVGAVGAAVLDHIMGITQYLIVAESNFKEEYENRGGI